VMGSESVDGEDGLRAVFMGTGVSTGLPGMNCIVGGGKGVCKVCEEGLRDVYSPNRRGNVSLLLQYGGRNILVDCGKTFRETALRWFRKHGVNAIDAVILTHGHADAVGGIDDLRDVQRTFSAPTPVYLNIETKRVCQSAYPYLFPRLEASDVPRRIAQLDWRVISDVDEFEVHGVPAKAFPVFHGGTYISLGFSFGKDKPFVYISDVSSFPEETLRTISSLSPISTLVIDALNRGGHNSHLSLPEAIEFVSQRASGHLFSFLFREAAQAPLETS